MLFPMLMHKVVTFLLNECDRDDEDERRDGGEWADGGVDEQLQHGDDQEIEVADTTELLEQIPENVEMWTNITRDTLQSSATFFDL